MQQILEAVYENGVFRPLAADALALSEGQRVHITVNDAAAPAWGSWR